MPSDEVFFTDINCVFIRALVLNRLRSHIDLVYHFTDAIKRVILDWLVFNAEKCSYHDGSNYAGDSYLWMTWRRAQNFVFRRWYQFWEILNLSFFLLSFLQDHAIPRQCTVHGDLSVVLWFQLLPRRSLIKFNFNILKKNLKPRKDNFLST